MTDGVEDSDDALRRQTLELAQRYQAFLGEGRLDEWISLWHDEAILEFPTTRGPPADQIRRPFSPT